MKSNRLNSWEMSLDQFISQTRAIRFPQMRQKTSQFSNLIQIGCHYYIYIDVDNLSVINPYTKKDKGKKYKSFFSSCSADHAKELAYKYIIYQIKDYL